MKTPDDTTPTGHPHIIVTISDSNYVIPTYVLILSLLRHQVRAMVHILGVGLTPEEKAVFSQFKQVRLFEADLSNARNAATRKAEALLTAENFPCDTVSLFDADCIVTGDLTRYLDQPVPGWSARFKTPAEDAMVFRLRYAPGEPAGGIPGKMLEIWQRDVGERTDPAIRNTVCGGNLTVHRRFLDFTRKWHNQMMKVLPNRGTKQAHDFRNFAYSQLDESVLNSLLAFAHDAPPLSRGQFDQDPSACLIHLGPCNPRYWTFWRMDRLRFYQPVVELIEWAQRQGWQTPKLTWSLKRAWKPLVLLVAYGYEGWVVAKRIARRFLKPSPKPQK
jgi:hypothetical protein